MKIQAVTAEEMRIAISGGRGVPLEQTPAWQKLSELEGNPVWRHLVWVDGDKTIGGATLYRYELRGLTFLWARGGPVWLKPPTPNKEAEALKSLRSYLRHNCKQAVFARVHANYWHAELVHPFRVIPFDRTVLIDGAKGNREKALQVLPSSGKRTVKRALRQFEQNEGLIQEETGLSREQFAEFYSILQETAARDGFTPHPEEYYWRFLTQLGPDHARLFALRLEGELVAWDLVGVSGKSATAFYGATSSRARSTQTSPLLDFEVACLLGEEGIPGLDLMGIHSPRVPQLYDVGRYKLQFSGDPVEVAGLWDLPLRSWLYRRLVSAYQLRKRVNSLRQRESA